MVSYHMCNFFLGGGFKLLSDILLEFSGIGVIFLRDEQQRRFLNQTIWVHTLALPLAG